MNLFLIVLYYIVVLAFIFCKWYSFFIVSATKIYEMFSLHLLNNTIIFLVRIGCGHT